MSVPGDERCLRGDHSATYEQTEFVSEAEYDNGVLRSKILVAEQRNPRFASGLKAGSVRTGIG